MTTHRHRGRLPARRRRRPGPRRPRGRGRHRRAARATARTPTCVTAPGKLVARARGPPRARRRPGSPWCPATTCPTTARWPRAWSASWPRPSTPASPPGSTEHVVVRHHDGRPDHPAHHRRRPRRGAGARPGSTTPSRSSPSPSREWVLSGDVPAGPPALGGRRGAVRRRHRAVRAPQAVAAQRRRTRCWPTPATLRGHETVAEAIADPVVRGWVEQWWDDAARHLPLPAEEIAAYRAALLERFANPRIRHLLAPDRRRRLAEAAGPDPADRAGRAGRRAGCRRVRRGCSPRGCATCAGRARRSPTWRPTSSPRSPRATSTTPWAAC